MGTTPSSKIHSRLLLLRVILVLILTTAAESEGKRPGCPDMCGNISIPFPFGIGPGCFRERFEVLCNHSYDPPRAFLAGNRIAEENKSPYGVRLSWSPLELVSISVATGEARAYYQVAYTCRTSVNVSVSTVPTVAFSDTPFAVSTTRNVLIGVGYSAFPILTYVGDLPALTCIASDDSDNLTARNGSCMGRGCCEATLSPDVGASKFFMLQFRDFNRSWNAHDPCNYGMLVEKSWYNFTTLDMSGNMTLAKRFPSGVVFALDFAVGNTSCPAEGQPPPPDYACVSGNSSCANATYTPGYICKCLDHYAGNPYVPNGCQDIDECKQPQVYPCENGGICKNRLGGYDCPCKFGMKADGNAGTCIDVFPPAAKAAVGAIVGIFIMAVLSFLVILQKEKKKTKEFYKKNGGPALEKAKGIKIFKKGALKPILKNSNIIGKGGFGEVYKGLLDNKEVAIKKPINGTMRENEQFANEVIIQSQVIHKNIVRLIGCCLEVEAPMLVYEFISQGSLHDILHNNNNKVTLNLDARLSIAAQSADGLAYMHSQANIRILHGDVKPANILLDENFAPKISDFGISRLLARDKEHTASIIGDMNYLDPVYLQEGLLTEKSDVYSFGVVILELISRRRAIHSENNSLVKSFLEAHKEQKKVTGFFDKEIAIAEDLELLDSLAGMAMECLSLDVDQRPTMMELAGKLHILSRSRKVQDVCHK